MPGTASTGRRTKLSFPVSLIKEATDANRGSAGLLRDARRQIGEGRPHVALSGALRRIRSVIGGFSFSCSLPSFLTNEVTNHVIRCPHDEQARAGPRSKPERVVPSPRKRDSNHDRAAKKPTDSPPSAHNVRLPTWASPRITQSSCASIRRGICRVTRDGPAVRLSAARVNHHPPIPAGASAGTASESHPAVVIGPTAKSVP